MVFDASVSAETLFVQPKIPLTRFTHSLHMEIGCLPSQMLIQLLSFLQTLMEKRVGPWINKKIVEYVGEEEPSLRDFICNKVPAIYLTPSQAGQSCYFGLSLSLSLS